MKSITPSNKKRSYDYGIYSCKWNIYFNICLMQIRTDFQAQIFIFITANHLSCNFIDANKCNIAKTPWVCIYSHCKYTYRKIKPKHKSLLKYAHYKYTNPLEQMNGINYHHNTWCHLQKFLIISEIRKNYIFVGM